MIVLNLKTYRESMGKSGVELCRIAERVSRKTGVKIIVCPATPDLQKAVESVSISVFAQHVDAVEPGANTGRVLCEAVKEIGCRGTLINHSERKITLNEIDFLIKKCMSLGLESLVCTASARESAAVAALEPSYIAVEPPELIGSGISVSTAKPEVVTDTIKAVKKIADVPVLCGAGVSNATDVKKALELGSDGVLLASAYVKAKEPEKLLLEMAGACKDM